MKQWLQNLWEEHGKRRDYYHKMAHLPLWYVDGAVGLLVFATHQLNFFPNFFKAMLLVYFILTGVWRLLIFFGAKHRPERWDKKF